MVEMGMHSGDPCFERIVFRAPVLRGDDTYDFEIARFEGPIYAAGFSDLVAGMRWGWHADLGVLLAFAQRFSPPNLLREPEWGKAMSGILAHHQGLEGRRASEPDGIGSSDPVLGLSTPHVRAWMQRDGRRDFSLQAHSAIGPAGPSVGGICRSGHRVELARSSDPEILLAAMQPLFHAADRDATREALARIPGIVDERRADRLRLALSRKGAARDAVAQGDGRASSAS